MLTHANLRAMNAAYFKSVDDIEGWMHCSRCPVQPRFGTVPAAVVERGATGDPGVGVLIRGSYDLLTTWKGVTSFMAPTMLTRLINDPVPKKPILQLKTIVMAAHQCTWRIV